MSKLIFATVETQELQFPYLYEQYEFLDDSCAPGQWRGGPAFAMRRVLTGSHPGFVNITVENNRHPLQGYAGGHPAVPSYAVFKPGTPDELHVRESVTLGELAPGDAIYTTKGAGGGWGPPEQRDPGAVLEDVLDGYVSVESARDAYGVVIVDSAVDEVATARLRAERRAAASPPG
jgi:N-methylhydantoinase B